MSRKNALRQILFVAIIAVASFAQARGFRLRIIDDATQQDIAHAKVTYNFGGGIEDQHVAADSQGAASIPLPDREPPNFYMTVSAPGFLSRQAWWFEDRITAIPKGFIIRLHKGVPASGSVVTTDGHPVASVKVGLIARDYLRDEAHPEAWPRQWDISPQEPVITDASGNWTSIAPRKCEQYSWLSLEHDGFIPSDTRLPAGEGALEHLPPVVLAPGASVTGIIRSEDGKPLANALLFPLTINGGGPMEKKVESSADGHYTIDNLSPAPTKILIIAPAMAPKIVDVAPSLAKQTTADVQLQPGKLLTGSVVDGAGKPVSGVIVNFTNYAGFEVWKLFVTTTDGAGKFSWPSAPEEEVRAYVSSGAMLSQQSVALRTGAENKITVRGPVHILLHVVEKTGGASIAKPVATLGSVYNDKPSWGMEKAEAASGDLLDLWNFSSEPAFYIRVAAPGHLPQVLGPFQAAAGDVEQAVRLESAPPSEGIVQLPSGVPAKNALVALTFPHGYVDVIEGRSVMRDAERAFTDGSGKFVLQPHVDKGYLLVMADEGFAWQAEDSASPIKLTPWGSIRGTLLENHKPLPFMHADFRFRAPDRVSGVPFYEATFRSIETDAEGHFSVDRLFPGTYTLERHVPTQQGPGEKMDAEYSYQNIFTVAAGQTVTASVGGVGSTITGKMVLPANLGDWNAYRSALQQESTALPVPADFNGKSEAEKTLWMMNYWDGQHAVPESNSLALAVLPVTVAPNGSFIVSDVPPGMYALNLMIRIPKAPDEHAADPVVEQDEGRWKLGYQVVTHVVVTADAPPGINIGTLIPEHAATAAVGQFAPDFLVKTLDGKPLHLADFRGKWVLLDLWSTTCPPCITELPNVRSVHRACKEDLTVIGISWDDDLPKLQAFLKAHDYTWTQTLATGWSLNRLNANYMGGIPQSYLINPDGLIVGADFHGPEMVDQIVKLMHPAAKPASP